jgi:hypothetical protein
MAALWRYVFVVPSVLAGLVTPSVARAADAAWKVYRNERFGYVLSYPPDMQLDVWIDGASGQLKDAATGTALVDIELWPVDMCPRQPKGLTARALGIQRAKDVTQADGAGSSSWCGDPTAVHMTRSPQGLAIFELKLTCESERDGDIDESDDDAPAAAAPSAPVRRREGTKGPTFFVDVSPDWQARVLLADPVGVDPRLKPSKEKISPTLLRRILATVERLPTVAPDVVCIDELGPTGLTIGRPAPRP